MDASIAATWCFPEESTPATARLLDAVYAGTLAHVPAIWPSEIANVLLKAARRGRITRDKMWALLEQLSRLAFAVDSSPLGHQLRVVRLAEEHQLSTYDAAYLELALRLRLPLATADQKLAAAARALSVPLVIVA